MKCTQFFYHFVCLSGVNCMPRMFSVSFIVQERSPKYWPRLAPWRLYFWVCWTLQVWSFCKRIQFNITQTPNVLEFEINMKIVRKPHIFTTQNTSFGVKIRPMHPKWFLDFQDHIYICRPIRTAYIAFFWNGVSIFERYVSKFFLHLS